MVASFSDASMTSNMSSPNSILLKDYLLDDLSSCSSNGFRSFLRRQCCAKVRYLIKIDLHKQSKSKSESQPKLKYSPILHKASAAVVNLIKNFRFSGFGKQKKKEFKIDEHEPIKQKSNNDSSISSDSYFTSNSSTTGGSSEMSVAESNVKESEELAMEKMNTARSTPDNAKKRLQGDDKDHFSPVSVMDFLHNSDNDDEDEVTSPFQHSLIYTQGHKQKPIPKLQRTKTIPRLNPVRLEDRITLSESTTHGSNPKPSLQIQSEFTLEENQAEKKASALLQLLKSASPAHDLSQLVMIESVLLAFFTERIIKGNVSSYTLLQEGKDWINGQTKEMVESQNSKPTCIRDLKEGLKWCKYEEEEIREVVLKIEYEVFTSLVEEMLLKF